MDFIPLNMPYLDENEEKTVIKILKSKNLMGDGTYCKKSEDLIKSKYGVKNCLLTSSCTHALELSMLVLEMQRGDEVILPSFNFVSSANAIVKQNLNPVFVDINLDDLNIDTEKIELSITNRTKAIIPMHYAGFACDMKTIMEIAKKYSLYVIEDAAQCIGSQYYGKFLGTIGDIGCYSFHNTKNIISGEGGAFLTNNEELALKAEIAREKGTNRSAFLRGEVDKYTWISEGSSFVLSDVLGGILFEQLKKVDSLTEMKKKAGLYYLELLKKNIDAEEIYVPNYAGLKDEINWHIFYVRVKSLEQRNFILHELKRNNIGASFHFIPLHSSPYGKKIFKPEKDALLNTKLASDTLIRLPIFPQITREQIEYIVDCLIDAIKRWKNI